ncbi:MAG: ComF family protein [Terriglobia bacterium]
MLRSALDGLASVLFAARCRLCDALLTSATRVPVCAACLGRVRPLELLAFCERCQRPLPFVPPSPESPLLCGRCQQGESAFDRLRSFGAYDAELRQLLVLLKYNGVRPLVGLLGGWLTMVLAQHPAVAEVDALVPVPLHPRRQRARGFNQAELLARELSRSTHLPVQSRWLTRIKDTPSQTGLTRAQREQNVRGAFASKAKLDNRRILLLDDVCTTGATLNACARTLKRAGAAQVEALTVARVVKEI